MVTYRDFTAAVEQIMNDVKVDSFYLVHHLLDVFFNGKEKITMEELSTFFGEFNTYYEPGDVEGFLKEVQFIKRENDEVDINELASMIRDDVELFYK